MNKTIKTMTTLMAGLALTLGLTFSSCKKGDTGPKGETGADGIAGPQAKTFNFNLTFSSGDTYKSYSGITGYDADDVVIVYVMYETLAGTNYWTQLPVILSNAVSFVPEFSETSGFLFINTLKASGAAGSPWTSTSTLAFKAVLIKSSQIAANPNINYKDYNAVKSAFKLSN